MHANCHGWQLMLFIEAKGWSSRSVMGQAELEEYCQRRGQHFAQCILVLSEPYHAISLDRTPFRGQ